MTERYSTADPHPGKPATGTPVKPPAPKSRIKPAKPYPEFPLYAHPAGVWAKKIRGKLHYFGKWNDPDAALNKYLEQKDALHAGRKPRTDVGDVTVKDAVNAYLNAKRALVEAGELGQRTWDGYKEATDQIIAAFGKTRLVIDLDPDDFGSLRKRMAKQWGPVRLGNVIQSIRSVFKHALECGLIDKPVRFGPDFKKPTKKVLRLHRAKQGAKLFAAEEIHDLLDAASPQLKAMVLLAVNAGMGNSDCSRLPLAALDLDGGWLNFARVKTGVGRRCWMWPETVQAIREALASRPEPKRPEDSSLLFVTKYGQPWTQTAITHELGKLLRKLGINGHRNFYALRHTHRTVADEARDQPAADAIMGHIRDDMSSVYRERIDDARLRAVAQHVHGWLFPPEQAAPADEPAILKIATA